MATEGYARTPLEEIPEMVAEVRNSFLTNKTLPLEFRKQQLMQLYKMVTENEEELLMAEIVHLRNPPIVNSLPFEVLKNDLVHVMDTFEQWAQDRVIARDPLLVGHAKIVHTPLGVATIMAPWNVPVQLTLSPFVGAIAAGCTVILKPSEITNQVAITLAKLIPEYLDPTCYKVVLGGVEESTELLKQRVDKIFYTGSPAVGKIIMTAAAKNLTPVSLELGGKNPVFVDDDADLQLVANRLAFGRYINTGQVCLCPEYILCSQKTQLQLLILLKKEIEKQLGPDPKNNPDYGRIVNNRHFQRIQKIIQDNSEKLVYGGDMDEKDNYIQPTILANLNPDDPVMAEEVFGPVLGIFTVGSLSQAIGYVRSQEKPLVCYIFSQNADYINEIVAQVDAGGIGVNDVLAHIGNGHDIPFGGVGNSGMGRYLGKFSFDSFTHEKYVVQRYKFQTNLAQSLICPPYEEAKVNTLKRLQGFGAEVPDTLTRRVMGKIMKVSVITLAGYGLYKVLQTDTAKPVLKVVSDGLQRMSEQIAPQE